MLPNELPSITKYRNCARRCHISAWFADAGLPAAAATALASEGISSGRGSGWALLAAEALPPPSITKSDAAFAAEGLEFVVGHETVSLAELNDLFERVLPPAGHQNILDTCAVPGTCGACMQHVAGLVTS